MIALLSKLVIARRAASMICMSIVLLLTGIATSTAAQVTIVALGTSNTLGRGVPISQAYPAQLQAALRARGHNVQVINMGKNGDTSAGMLARLNSVPRGTQVVLLEIWPNQEVRSGITSTSANSAAIHSQLAARNIKIIDMTGIFQNEHRAAAAAGNEVPTPAGPHLNPTAYSHVVAQVLPEVEAAIGQ